MDNFLFWPRALAAAISDISFAAALGFVVVALWLDRAEYPSLHGRLRLCTLCSLTALLAAFCAQAFLVTATMIGSANLDSVRGQIAAVLTGTHAGRVVLIESIFPAALIVLLLTRYGRRTRAGLWSALSILVVLAAIRSAIGHSAGDGDFNLAEFMQAIHLASTAVWAGCVIAAGLIVLPALLELQRFDHIPQFTRRLSGTVTTALALIVLSGIYNSYRGLGGSLAPLAETQWGKLLDVKLVLIGVALALGALNRRLIQSDRSLSPKECGRLATMLRFEAAIMLLILTASAFLANSPPAN